MHEFAIFVAGATAGFISTVIGSGMLFLFPVLVAVGVSPVTANISSMVGLLPGGLTGAIGYRRELVEKRSLLFSLGAASAAGGTTGSILLLTAPESVFEAVVPFLICVCVTLVLGQPWLFRRLSRAGMHVTTKEGPRWPSSIIWVAIFLAGVIGAYFGAAQGILLISILGTALPDPLQCVIAVKNVLALIVAVTATCAYMTTADIRWDVTWLIATGSALGGWAGARIGRRLSAQAIKTAVVIVSVASLVDMFLH
jgi:uncharacterized membrane protein YfcA